MLVLSRKLNEEIVVDGPCVIRIAGVKGRRVAIGVKADRETKIVRAEAAQTREKRPA